MTAALDRLKESVAANTSATDSVLQLITTLSGEIRDNADDSDALNALADKLDAESALLANAVAANTSTPAPAPAPAPEGDTAEAPTPADPTVTPNTDDSDPLTTGA